ncbi:hypothetical protein CJP74_00715 [Psittacicella melopsittaci]|uniref:Uncharacterized protein n=1 Tax=Psittacicella melopsittaci TaxID=2028576 RepID=A0A3A1YCB6_9GAMM|nr:hypothetical protein [Psittacicella melopsittaci]RIY33854.1 hypothetical protein CJP74_00715 [Psittacicella melopsittaci]
MKKLFLCLLALGAVGAKAEQLNLYGQTYSGDLIYLGCINCSQYNSDSIWNEYGRHGYFSNHGRENIWNQHSDYGSRYSSYSAFSSYCSKDAPLVIGAYSKEVYGTFCIGSGYIYGNRTYAYRDILEFLSRNYESMRGVSFSRLTEEQRRFINRIY